MYKKITVIIFCVFLFAFSIISWFVPDNEESERENTVLTTLDDLSFDGFFAGDTQETFEEYIDDQFFLRETWIDLSTGITALIGNKDINGIYIGEDGYLIEKYTDEDFDTELVEENIDILTWFLNDMTETYGSGHVDLVMIPSKAGAMPDYLPAFAQGYPEEEITYAIEDLLDEPDILLDLTDTLIEHQDEYIYYRTDHHWTTLGAWYGYAAYAEKKGFEVLALDSFETEIVSEDFYGTSYNKLHRSVEQDTVTLYHSEAEENITINMNDGETISDSFYFLDALEDSDKYSVFLSGNTEKIVIETGAESGRVLLMLKDSFSNCFVPFLITEYDTIIMYDLRYAGDTIDVLLDEYGSEITDVLVMYNIEKFMQDENIDLLDY